MSVMPGEEKETISVQVPPSYSLRALAVGGQIQVAFIGMIKEVNLGYGDDGKPFITVETDGVSLQPVGIREALESAESGFDNEYPHAQRSLPNLTPST